LDIKIKLFQDFEVESCVLQVETGKYAILGDNVKILPADLETSALLTITAFEGKIKIEKGVQFLGTFSSVEFLGTKYTNNFSLKIAEIPVKRVYEENLSVRINNGLLTIINNISLEKYVAGVVQSEVFGSSNDLEFFKIQAIVSRTYCLANLNRHLAQGANLCDGTHCQSYKGKCTQPNILRAAYETFCDVVVDTANRLVSTAYHSNSGGMTESALNVWGKDMPYLQAIKDTFSLRARNARWEKTIPKNAWTEFFVKNYGDKYTQAPLQSQIMKFEPDTRQAYWIIDADTIPTKDIRMYFKLRSSFFTVAPKGDAVVLHGRGYGHGVGLSQEGAIEMVKQGYGAADILKFYYIGTNVIKYTDIIDL
jgi:stage II sporulation protein D